MTGGTATGTAGASTSRSGLSAQQTHLTTTLARRSWWLAVIVVAGAVLRAAPWLRPNTLLGVMEYDDGVYYGAARALLHGMVPYRDFTVLHPPLTSVLLLPAALVGAGFGDPAGMAAARIEVLLAECVNVWLVYVLVRRIASGTDRTHRIAPLAAAAVYAVAPGAVAAGHTVLLEPLTNLFVLSAMALLLRRTPTTRAAAAGGALLAAALGVKIFAAVYVVVAVGWIACVARDRLLPMVAGFVGMGAAVFGPFVALAGPSVVWRDVVTTQLTRPSDGAASTRSRVLSLFGTTGVPVWLGLLVAASCVVAGGWATTEARKQRAGFPPQLWAWSAVAILAGAAFLRSPSFFAHYAGFFAAPFAVTVGIISGLVPDRRLLLRAVAIAAVSALLVVATAASVRSDVRVHGGPSLAAATRTIPSNACVYTDAVSLVIAADRFRLPDPTCPGWIDGRGQNLVWSIGRRHDPEFYPHGFLVDARWQTQTLNQLQAAAYLLVRTDPRTMPEWVEQTRAYVSAHFRQVWVGRSRGIGAQLWVRVS